MTLTVQKISKSFASFNVIDMNNHLRQDLLQLEKKWLTRNPFFCLATYSMGINVTNMYLLADYHKVINLSNDPLLRQNFLIHRFVGIFALQLIKIQIDWDQQEPITWSNMI